MPTWTIRAAAAAIVMTATGVAFIGCISDPTPQPEGAPPFGTASTAPPPSGPADTGDVAKRSAIDIAVAQVRSLLPMTDAQASCVADRLAAEPDVVAELSQGPSVGSEAFDRAEDLTADCTAHDVGVPAFVDAISSQRALTAEARTCVEQQLRARNAKELTALGLGGALEDGTTLGSVMAACGVP
jgi:hypothetical protein